MHRRMFWLLLALLCGCASEWRTEAPVVPMTYEAPSLRSVSSVGRLGRLAVMPAAVHLECDEDQPRTACDERRNRLGGELQSAVSKYLTAQKGYEAHAVSGPLPVADVAAIRDHGQHLGVDGVVIVERWVAKPWSTAKGILNVFTLNIPLFRALNAVNLRIGIYATSTGALVWQRELKGEDSGDSLDMAAALGDLENAVPPQLRR